MSRLRYAENAGSAAVAAANAHLTAAEQQELGDFKEPTLALLSELAGNHQKNRRSTLSANSFTGRRAAELALRIAAVLRAQRDRELPRFDYRRPRSGKGSAKVAAEDALLLRLYDVTGNNWEVCAALATGLPLDQAKKYKSRVRGWHKDAAAAAGAEEEEEEEEEEEG